MEARAEVGENTLNQMIDWPKDFDDGQSVIFAYLVAREKPDYAINGLQH